MQRKHANSALAEATRVVRVMPDPAYAELWDSIVVNPSVKERPAPRDGVESTSAR